MKNDMPIRDKKVRANLEKFAFAPDKEVNIKHLEFLFSQFLLYPHSKISSTETMEGNIKLIESVIQLWSVRKSDYFREHYIEEIPGNAAIYLDMEEVDSLIYQAQSLLVRLRRDLLPVFHGSELVDTANVMFKLGFLFSRLDHDVTEADAIAQERLAKKKSNENKGIASARKRVWWGPHWQSLAESFMEANPNVTKATEVAREILPAINAKKKASQSPLTLENLAKAIRTLKRRK